MNKYLFLLVRNKISNINLVKVEGNNKNNNKE